MGRVADILATKGREVQTIARDASVFEALETMVRNNIGSLVVTQGDDIVGIFTERDYLRRVALAEKDPKKLALGEVMTEKLVCLDPCWSVEESMAVMTHQRIRHLPVLEGGKLAGLVSIGDLVKHVSDERTVEIRYLTDYITGKYPG